MDESQKAEIEGLIKDLRESLTSEDPAELNAKTEALQSAFHKVSEAMYEKASAQQSANGASADGEPAASAAGDEEVVDAEVVDEATPVADEGR
jgi:molecular chaperone DnaK